MVFIVTPHNLRNNCYDCRVRAFRVELTGAEALGYWGDVTRPQRAALSPKPGARSGFRRWRSVCGWSADGRDNAGAEALGYWGEYTGPQGGALTQRPGARGGDE